MKQRPVGRGYPDRSDLHGELGDIVAGTLSGRTDDDGITLFDSTGLAIQDVAAAHVVYENASDDGDGTAFSLVDTGPPDSGEGVSCRYF